MNAVESQKAVASRSPWMRQIEVQIIPNGYEQASKTYRLSLLSGGHPEGWKFINGGGAYEENDVGYVQVWRGHSE